MQSAPRKLLVRKESLKSLSSPDANAREQQWSKHPTTTVFTTQD